MINIVTEIIVMPNITIVTSPLVILLFFISKIYLISHMPYYKIHIAFYCELIMYFNILIYHLNLWHIILTKSEVCLLLFNMLTFYAFLLDNLTSHILYILIKIFIVYNLHKNYYGVTFKQFIDNTKNMFIEVYELFCHFKEKIIFGFIVALAVDWIYDLSINIYTFCNLSIHAIMFPIMFCKWLSRMRQVMGITPNIQVIHFKKYCIEEK